MKNYFSAFYDEITQADPYAPGYRQVLPYEMFLYINTRTQTNNNIR